jgi:hypothetical protein
MTMMHCFNYHLCLCGIVLQAFRDDTKRILMEMNTDLAIIPGRLSVLRSLIVSVNKPPKVVRRLCMQGMAEIEYELTPTGKIRNQLK